MENGIKVYSKNFNKSILKLLSGNFVVQIISFLSAPFITRVFSPKEYGLAAICIAYSSLLSLIITGSYEFTIVKEKSYKNAFSLLLICFGFSSIFYFTLVVFIFISLKILPIIMPNFYNSDYIKLIWIIPLYSYIYGLSKILNYWFTRENKYFLLSLSKVLGSITLIFSYLGFFLFDKTLGIHIFYSQIFSQSIIFISLGIIFFINGRKYFKKNFSFKRIIYLTNKYKKYPIYYSPANLINNISQELPKIFLGFIFGETLVGYYSLSVQVINAPLAILGGSVSQVFFEISSKIVYEKKELKFFLSDILNKLINISVFPILMIGISSVWSFGIIFGNQWASAGLVALILSPWQAIYFISTNVSILTAVLDMQKMNLYFSFVSILLRVLSITIGWQLKSFYLSILLFSISGFLICLAKIFIYSYKAKLDFKQTSIIFFKNRKWLIIPLFLLLVVFPIFNFLNLNIFIYFITSLITSLFWFGSIRKLMKSDYI